jgi:peptidoglycan/LPS O-acetylase OafA/YrhL
VTDKRSDIQALRALAVVTVVVGHMNPHWLPGGYLGVDIFFVISGFVITQILTQQRNGVSQLWFFLEFWLKRVFRIVPAYFVMLLIVATATAILFLPENFSQFSDSWKKSLLFLSNQYFATYGDYFSPASNEQPLLHTWSLAVEMQFYLGFPLVIYGVVKLNINGSRWIGLFTVLWFVAAQWAWSRNDANSALYYSLFVRIPEFLLGALVALRGAQVNSRHSVVFVVVGLVLIFASLVYVDASRFNPAYAAVVCIGVCLILYGNIEKGLIAFAFKVRLLMVIGAMSYSIYLWHWPILALWRYSLGEISWDFRSVVFYVSIVLVLSWLSWRFVEERFRRIPVGRSAIAHSLVFLLVLGVLPAAYGKVLNLSIPQAPLEERRYADGASICHGQILSTCMRGVASNPKFMLIGDSHAAQLNIATARAGQKLGVGIEVLTASSCVPLIGFNVDKLPQSSQAPCRDQIAYVSSKLGQPKILLLAAMWSYQFEDPTFTEVLHKFLEQATNNKQRVIVFGQVPKLSVNPQRANRMSNLGFDAPVYQTADWRIANEKLEKILHDYPSISYYNPSSSVVFSTPPFYNSHMIYHDSHHINEIGSGFYGDLLEKALESFGVIEQ